MRLAFSTLGVPGLPVPDVVRLAAGSGFHGVELRAHPEEPVHPGLPPAARAEVAGACAAAGIDVLAVAGYARVAEPGADEPVLTEVRALLELARDLGAGYVRVFPGGGDADPAEADATAVRRLSALAPAAAGLGVRLLLETHDSHGTGAAAARVLTRVNHTATGALWDVMHTWRGGEDPEESHRLLAPYLGYVQVKDIGSAEDTTPLVPGEGVLPLAEVVEVLSRANWDGWLCWEYEKRWYPEVPELPAALPAVRDHLLRLLTAAA
ncbi:sugar phosphate isomerase/epimerase [Streptomyces sp. JJ36]|uniref:sugar phosphate isomerase/epimerase family protein n=1 Tax=Streptomyces sp. JJ36 TaxID=2736645 RepID=UPI001F3BC474|nr:sugar phosphate isomerase/epimerase family protein [Streptomyces sp. JJ36]MCF6523729.1 sugar phosphate isomerase/epimerase [Streptomyces sp. JJ36]